MEESTPTWHKPRAPVLGTGHSCALHVTRYPRRQTPHPRDREWMGDAETGAEGLLAAGCLHVSFFSALSLFLGRELIVHDLTSTVFKGMRRTAQAHGRSLQTSLQQGPAAGHWGHLDAGPACGLRLGSSDSGAGQPHTWETSWHSARSSLRALPSLVRVSSTVSTGNGATPAQTFWPTSSSADLSQSQADGVAASTGCRESGRWSGSRQVGRRGHWEG